MYSTQSFRLRIVQKFSEGGCGSLYTGEFIPFDTNLPSLIALKLVFKDEESSKELETLRQLQNFKGFPRLKCVLPVSPGSPRILIGTTLLGNNLSSFIQHHYVSRPEMMVLSNCYKLHGQNSNLNNFPMVHILKETLSRLREMHLLSLMHCDIKFSNFCVGLNFLNDPTIYLLDFGFCETEMSDFPENQVSELGLKNNPMKLFSKQGHANSSEKNNESWLKSQRYLSKEKTENQPKKSLSKPSNIQRKKSIKGTILYLSPSYAFSGKYRYIDDLVSLFYSFLEVLLFPRHQIFRTRSVSENLKAKRKWRFLDLAKGSQNIHLLLFGSFLDQFFDKNKECFKVLKNWNPRVDYTDLFIKLGLA